MIASANYLLMEGRLGTRFPLVFPPNFAYFLLFGDFLRSQVSVSLVTRDTSHIQGFSY